MDEHINDLMAASGCNDLPDEQPKRLRLWSEDDYCRYLHDRDTSHPDPATRLGLSEECPLCMKIVRQFMQAFGEGTILEAIDLWIEAQNHRMTAAELEAETMNKLIDKYGAH